MESQELPLFPLNTVLFPGMTLPLHIFEERYKLMIGRCLEGSSTFGVVLIKSGSEVGERAEPYEVGTIAKITEVTRLADGRMNIITEGVERFKVLSVTQERPYLSGKVELLEDEPGNLSAIKGLESRTREAFESYIRLLLALAGQWQRQFELPSDLVELSYSIASSLKVDLPIKQKLLETTSTAKRFEQEVTLLDQEISRLQRLVQYKWQNVGGTGYPVN